MARRCSVGTGELGTAEEACALPAVDEPVRHRDTTADAALEPANHQPAGAFLHQTIPLSTASVATAAMAPTDAKPPVLDDVTVAVSSEFTLTTSPLIFLLPIFSSTSVPSSHVDGISDIFNLITTVSSGIDEPPGVRAPNALQVQGV